MQPCFLSRARCGATTAFALALRRMSLLLPLFLAKVAAAQCLPAYYEPFVAEPLAGTIAVDIERPQLGLLRADRGVSIPGSDCSDRGTLLLEIQPLSPLAGYRLEQQRANGNWESALSLGAIKPPSDGSLTVFFNDPELQQGVLREFTYRVLPIDLTGAELRLSTSNGLRIRLQGQAVAVEIVDANAAPSSRLDAGVDASGDAGAMPRSSSPFSCGIGSSGAAMPWGWFGLVLAWGWRRRISTSSVRRTMPCNARA